MEESTAAGGSPSRSPVQSSDVPSNNVCSDSAQFNGGSRDEEAVGAEAEPAQATSNGAEPIDKLTALEMLQLLKEYKELFLNSNSSSQSSALTAFNKFPSPFYPIIEQCQLALFDPTVNLEIRELRLKLFEQGSELQKTKDELRAATFSADSVMGRRLINKCKALQEENTDIGKMLLENQLQPLQVQMGILEKQLSFFKQQLKVLHELNSDLDEGNEKLTRQLQETVQQERDILLKEKERPGVRSSATRRSESRRRSSSRGTSYRRPSKEGSARHQKAERTRRRRDGGGSEERSYGRRRSGSGGRRGRSDSR